jgi:hypothetical protein
VQAAHHRAADHRVVLDQEHSHEVPFFDTTTKPMAPALKLLRRQNR